VLAAGENVIRNIKIVNEDGSTFEKEGDKDPFIKVDWSASGIELEPGKIYTAQIPETLKVEAKQSGKLEADNEEIGTYEVGVGAPTIQLIFNEKVEENSSARGTFQIRAVLIKEDTTTVKDDSGTEPQQKDPEGVEENISSENDSSKVPPADTESLEAENNDSFQEDEGDQGDLEDEADSVETGTKLDEEQTDLNEGQPEDPRIITENILTGFKLKLENKGTSTDVVDKDTLVGIEYTWALKNSHGYKAGAKFHFQLPKELKVYNVVDREPMYFNNKVIGYFTVTTEGSATIEFTEVIEQFSNINGKLEVWTEIREDVVITDGGLTITPIEGGQSVTIPVSLQPGGSAVEKKGTPNRSYNGDTITWAIDINKKLESLKDAKLIDLIQSGQKLKAGSLKLYKLDTRWNGDFSLGGEVTPNFATGDDFTINLGDINSAYRLVYETEITDGDATKYSNTATLTAGSTTVDSVTAPVTIQRGSPLKKEAKQYNKAEQSIEWEVRYNYNEKKIDQDKAILKDFFTNSQELIANSIIVKEVTIDPETGKEIKSVDFDNYNVTPHSIAGKNGFEIAFGQAVEKAYKITYKTKAKDRVYGDTEIKNEVAAGIYSTGEVGQPIGPQILFKSHGTANYATKEIGWTIRVNSDNHTMKNIVIEDTFTNAGLTFKIAMVAVSEGGVALSNDDYTVREKTGGFTIEFNKVIEKEVLITYKTNFDYEQRTDKALNYLENMAHIKWQDTGGTEKDLVAKAAFKPDDYTLANGFKNGSYNAVKKEITWEVGVNYNLQTLDKAVVEDTFEGNQKLLENTIKVYEMSLTGESNGIKLGEAVEGKDYEITYPDGEEKTFRIVFKKQIDKPYKIEYTTAVKGVDLVAKEYKNTARLLNNGTEQTNLPKTVTTPYGGKYTDKSGTQNGMVIDWKIDINFAESLVQNAKVYDKPDDKQIILPDSLKVYKAKVTGNGQIVKGGELESDAYTVDFTEKPDSFTLKFAKTISEPYILEYKTRIIAAVGENINNAVTFSGENITQQASSSKPIEVRRTNGMGSGTGELGALTVLKKDSASDKLLKGAKFVLADAESGSILGTAVTGEEGKVIFDRLLYGTYTLKEVETPEGYVGVADQIVTIDKPYTVDDEDKPGNTYTVKNKKIIHAVQLKKVDQAEKTLEGAIFSLERKNGSDYEIVKSNLKTDVNGLIEEDGLQPGEYRFIETTAPDGYQIDKTPINFKIGEKDTKVKEVRAVNLKAGSVLLKKVDATNSGIVLEGAEFKLLDQSGEELHSGLRTNENGELIVSKLQPGTYQFVETKAPFGYKLDTSPKSFTLEPGKTNTIQIEFTNDIQPGSVQLTKVDDVDETKVLAGAKFSLQKTDGSEISNYTTDELGQIVVEDLLPGEYQFVETAAPFGYEFDDGQKTIKFTIEKGGAKLELTAKNKAIPGDVVITKVDGKTDKTLAGAEFRLEDVAGNIKVENLLTNNEGIVEVKNLAPTKYKLVETKAPAGYRKLSTPVEFTIEVGQEKALNLVVTNTKLSTGGGGGTPPVDPEEPGKPTDPPVDPEEPGKPTDPPVDPEEPGKPTNPPVDPEEPGKPTNPPVNPEKPGKPTNPPKEPGKPGKPTDPPTKPGKPGKPNDPNVTENQIDKNGNKPGKPNQPGKGGVLGEHVLNKENGNKTGKNNELVNSNNQKINKNLNSKDSGNNNLNGIEKLPQTGEQRYLYMIFLGILMSVSGVYLLLTKSRRRA